MMLRHLRELIKICQNEGIISGVYAIKRFLLYRLQNIRRKMRIKILNTRINSDTIVREINNSKMKLNINPESPHKIERTLALNKIREPASTQIYEQELANLRQKYKQDILVMDIGANVGYYALLAAHLLGNNDTVKAIEADANNAKRLQQNIALNNYSNIEVIPIAAGAERTETKLGIRSSSNTHRISDVLEDATPSAQVDVEVYPVDDLIEEYRLSKEEIVIIRMDVEGYENYVFEGMDELLSSEHPIYMFIELHTNRKSVDVDKIISQLEENGFIPKFASFDGGDTYEHIDSFENVRFSDKNVHLFTSRIVNDG